MKKRGTITSHPQIEQLLKPVSDIELDFSPDYVVSSPVKSNYIKIIPSKYFSEIPSKNFGSVFISKCQECCIICDFSNASMYHYQIDTKSLLLRHLIAGISDAQVVRQISRRHFIVFINMISINIFRSFPSLPKTIENAKDSSWPHLSLIYQCLKNSLDVFNFYSNIDDSFLYKLLKNGLSFDERERAFVCSIVYELCLKFPNLRPKIIQHLSSLFSIQLCSKELLNALSLIVSASPKLQIFFDRNSKEDKQRFFNLYINFVLPLHLVPSLTFSTLIECTLSFIEKDFDLFPTTFQFLLNHWPITDCEKQQFYLREISLLFERCFSSQVFLNEMAGSELELIDALIDLISFCVSSDHCEVIKLALQTVSLVLTLVSKIRGKIIDNSFILKNNIYAQTTNNLNKLYLATTKASNSHWDEAVRASAFDMALLLSQMNMKRTQELHKLASEKEVDEEKMNEKWALVMKTARRRYRTIKFII